ncbi:MAG: hydroxymethylbilane synthase [Candidatus Omnitrophica bacterium]|nr:hydroxymethylbilane synthase [Candidatus Omnitrophota bacterium]
MRTIIFGIRKSALAKRQLEEFIAFLENQKLTFKYDVKTIVTQGDKDRTSPLHEMGQGIFTKEIERALLRREIDCAVHSLKDMPVKIEQGTICPCFPPRLDVRDCVIGRRGVEVQVLKGLRIGTGSPRRSEFLKEIESDVEILPLRGNVETRLRKLDNGDYDAIILAACGLKRLGYTDRISRYFDPDQFVPAAGQGIICAQTRLDDDELNGALKKCSSWEAEEASVSERKVLEALGIGCQMPFGVYARFEGENFIITAKFYMGSKKSYVYARRTSLKADRETATADLIRQLKMEMGKES